MRAISRASAASTAPVPAPVAESLVERYARTAHAFQRGPIDAVLRALDVVLALVALVALSPLILVVAATLLVSGHGGPVLYRGLRVGRAGRLFTMLKFRTLQIDAETRLGPYLGAELTQLTVSEVTRVGRWLRVTKLDELPQLWNVLRGDMSMVGPRPIRPAFFEELCQEIPQYWQRLVVRPGLTGFAQLRLTRDMTWSEKLAHDFEYVADRSVRLYLVAIAQTAWLVLMRPIDGLARRRRG